MMQEKLVTVVVPIYNVEKYLEKCISSLINQTYKNIEILLINDGSTDKCLEICQDAEKKDNRIRIINQENQGLSGARNTGINNARGEYISFIDSDDFIHKDFIKLLLENLIQSGADISVCDFFYIDEDGMTWGRKEKKQAIFNNIEAIKDILVGKQETEVMAWNKLYKTSLFKENNIYYPKRKLHEDNFTTYKLYYYSKKIALIPDRLYFYLQRDTSIMGKKFNTKRLDAYEAINETKKFFFEKKINISEELDAYEFIVKIYILDNMIRSKFDGNEKKELIKELKNNKKRYLKNNYISKKLKFAIFILFGKGKLYKFLLLLYDLIRKNK